MRYLLKINSFRDRWWKFFYLCSFVLLFISLIYGCYGHNIRSIFCLSLFFIATFISFFNIFFMASTQREQIIKQLFPIYTFLAIFWDLSFYSVYTDKTYPLNIYIGLFVLNIPMVFMGVKLFGLETRTFSLLKKTKNNKYLIFFLLLFILLSLETLNSWTRLDSDIYYYYLQEAQKWNLSFDSLNLFRLGGHQSMGYTFFGLLGVYLTPNSPIGLRLVNILIICISSFCFYAILKYFIKDNSLILLLTGMFIFNPLVLGTIYEINLDLPMTCFYIWTIYALLYNNKIYLFFSAFLLAFSKETGIILLFGIALGWGINEIRNIVNNKHKKWVENVDFKTCICVGLPMILWLIFKKMGFVWRDDRNSISISSNTMDKIGLNLDNTLIKIKELFFLNFSWLFTICIIYCLTKLLLKKQQVLKTKKILSGLPIIFSSIFFISFQFIHITYCHIRYITPYWIGLIWIFGIFIANVFSKRKRLILCFSILCLLGVQCFYTIDPVSRRICNTINIGKTEIYTTRTFVRGSNNEIQTKSTNPELLPYFEMTQSVIYNRQYMYFENAFEKLLKEIKYDDDTLLLVAPIYDILPDMTWISLFGKWYTDKLYYDPNNYRVVDNVSYPTLNLEIIHDIKEINNSKYNRIYLLSFPYNPLYDIENLVSNYDIINSFDIVKNFWSINVYQLK